MKEKKAVSPDRFRELQLFQNNLGIYFKNITLLNLALTHCSFLNEGTVSLNNERLEFLGDSVLGLIACDFLYLDLPDQKEGYLAKIKSYVVSEDLLAKIAIQFKLDRYLLLGKGEECTGGRLKKTILADAMEAVIGGYYLDSGFKAVESFVKSFLIPEIIMVKENRHHRDYKTLLQEYVQKTYKGYPKYRLVSKTGPDHDRTFLINVDVMEFSFGPGSGKSKKDAEQIAAQIACHYFSEKDSVQFALFESSKNSV